jgi:hypothetical protein
MDLYGLPLEEFVAERDKRAKELRASGEREDAEAVKKLPKPTRGAWAVNVAVRADPEAAADLVEAVRLLESTQAELLAGGDASALRQATEHARDAIERLVKAAPSHHDKVRETLYAAIVDPEVLAEVREGRVAREHVASGFGGLAGLAAAVGPERGGGGAKVKAKPKAKAKAKQPAPPARAAPKKRAVPPAQLRRAKEAEAAAEGEVDAARRALEQAEAALADRRKQLAEAEKRLTDARRRRERLRQPPCPFEPKAQKWLTVSQLRVLNAPPSRMRTVSLPGPQSMVPWP